MSSSSHTDIDHVHYLTLALNEARKSPPKPTNFCVGALLLSPSLTSSPTDHPDPRVLATGYTLEQPGNTHAEQCCFIQLARRLGSTIPLTLDGFSGTTVEGRLGPRLPDDTILYTTMEPCNKRSVGNTPCVDRILALKNNDGRPAIKTIVVGVMEPETFVGVNQGKQKLEEAGIEVIHMKGFEDEILKVATAGHEKKDGNAT